MPKHPYHILIENLSQYSKILKPKDIHQYSQNVFQINDVNFDKLAFFNDVTNSTGIQVKKHEYITASCSDPEKCFKPYVVYGFDNVLFYFRSKNY
jgi:hypothetical protein